MFCYVVKKNLNKDFLEGKNSFATRWQPFIKPLFVHGGEEDQVVVAVYLRHKPGPGDREGFVEHVERRTELKEQK